MSRRRAERNCALDFTAHGSDDVKGAEVEEVLVPSDAQVGPHDLGNEEVVELHGDRDRRPQRPLERRRRERRRKSGGAGLPDALRLK
jgi:hypothetical protein